MTSSDGPLTASYRVVRPVRAPHDAPWPGVLVRFDAGDTLVLVDAAVLGAQWRGWDSAPDGHVLGAVDLLRRVDGHDAAVPVCTERLEDFLRRRAARMPLGPGEAVTVAVSILRGCAELADAPESKGQWWLDAAGRPVVAPDTGTERVTEAAIAVLALIAVPSQLASAWDQAIRALTTDRVSVRAMHDAEEALFAVTDAEPLTTVVLGPRSASDVGTARPIPALDSGPPRSMWQRLAGHVDADLADTVSLATTAVWRRLRTRPSGRRAPWLVGGVAAAAVLVGGALWPAAGGVATESPTVADTPSPTVTEAVQPAPTTPADEPVVADEPGDETAGLAQIVSQLLASRAECADDATCLADVMADPAGAWSAGAVDLPASARTVSLIDDYGDVAVLRADAADGSMPSQLVVVMRRNEQWLLRDVHDVAQQPS